MPYILRCDQPSAEDLAREVGAEFGFTAEDRPHWAARNDTTGLWWTMARAQALQFPTREAAEEAMKRISDYPALTAKTARIEEF